jgi:hypothetical protein
MEVSGQLHAPLRRHKEILIYCYFANCRENRISEINSNG